MAVEKKDIWDKLSIVTKGVLGVVITAMLGILGYMNDVREDERNSRMAEIAESNRITQVRARILNSRENAAAQMRVQMFKTLMDRYFDPSIDADTKIAVLELIGINFQNHLYLKPLFLKLNEELKDEKRKRKLRRVAHNINEIEINNILGNGGNVSKYDLDMAHTIKHGLLNLRLLEIAEDRIRISPIEENTEGFVVTFFDTPLMDNSQIGSLKYSILLSKIDLKGKTAKIKLVELPPQYYNIRNKLYLDACLADMTKKREGQVQKEANASLLNCITDFIENLFRI